VLAGGDLLAAAQTGTGKTAGFTLPILHILAEEHAHNIKPGRPRCLILTPTRELAAQVEESVQTYGKHLPLTSMVMFGGVNINPQIAKLKKRWTSSSPPRAACSTTCNQKTIDLSGVEILVLDEADRMLDMGFIRDIKKILAMLPKKRQNLLFSATFSDEIKALADGLLHEPGFVEVARATRPPSWSPVGAPVPAEGEARAARLPDQEAPVVPGAGVHPHQAWRQQAGRIPAKHDIPSAAIHGNKSQSARTRALADFKDAKLQVLVATDIAARGLDIDQLPQVVNFELPNVLGRLRAPHRPHRPCRLHGAAVSLVDAEELPLLKDIERLMKRLIDARRSMATAPHRPAASRSTATARRPATAVRRATRPAPPARTLSAARSPAQPCSPPSRAATSAEPAGDAIVPGLSRSGRGVHFMHAGSGSAGL
jgi:ATP-dependent RNA helicase RhlE